MIERAKKKLTRISGHDANSKARSEQRTGSKGSEGQTSTRILEAGVQKIPFSRTELRSGVTIQKRIYHKDGSSNSGLSRIS